MTRMPLYIPNLNQHLDTIRAHLADCEVKNKPVRASDFNSKLDMPVRRVKVLFEKLMNQEEMVSAKVGRNTYYFRSHAHMNVVLPSIRAKHETSEKEAAPKRKASGVNFSLGTPKAKKSEGFRFDDNAEVVDSPNKKVEIRARAIDYRYELTEPFVGEFSKKIIDPRQPQQPKPVPT